MENTDWFIDMVLFLLGAVTSTCASSPSLKRSGISIDSLRASFFGDFCFLLSLRPAELLPLSCDAISSVCVPVGRSERGVARLLEVGGRASGAAAGR